jgi:hypothetical protein
VTVWARSNGADLVKSLHGVLLTSSEATNARGRCCEDQLPTVAAQELEISNERASASTLLVLIPRPTLRVPAAADDHWAHPHDPVPPHRARLAPVHARLEMSYNDKDGLSSFTARAPLLPSYATGSRSSRAPTKAYSTQSSNSLGGSIAGWSRTMGGRGGGLGKRWAVVLGTFGVLFVL